MLFPGISFGKPALILAPMEGVTDAPMRTLLTERGGFSFSVSEFLRVTQGVLPPRTYHEHVPELLHGCKTPAGTPIQIQLLGGDEELLALSAKRACELGAPAIDLNFGCPAPTVNRNDGGATLLKYPHRIRSIVEAVRQAVPISVPVSAKLRLGWENMEDIYHNAEQAVLGGAAWLTIHGRTKVQGYVPPAHWKYIGEVRRQVNIPVVANGEIWTLSDFLRCQEQTGCEHYMLGRGALGDPSLVHEISRSLGIEVSTFEQYPYSQNLVQWEPVILRFAELTKRYAPHTQYTTRRIKQWLRFAQTGSSLPWFENIKRCQSLDEILTVIRTQ